MYILVFIYTGRRCAVQHTIHSKFEDIDYRYLPQAYSQAYQQPGLSTARLIYSQAYGYVHHGLNLS